MSLIGVTSISGASYRRPTYGSGALSLSYVRQSAQAAVRQNGLTATYSRNPVYPKVFPAQPEIANRFFVGISERMRGGISF